MAYFFYRIILHFSLFINKILITGYVVTFLVFGYFPQYFLLSYNYYFNFPLQFYYCYYYSFVDLVLFLFLVICFVHLYSVIHVPSLCLFWSFNLFLVTLII